MTIGIGVLCSTQPRPHKPRPDAFVLISDTMGSTETDSNNDTYKMYVCPTFCAVSAGRTHIASEYWGLMEDALSAIPEPRSHGNIWRTLNEVRRRHRQEHFLHGVVATKYMVTGNHVDERDRENMMKDFSDYDVGVEALLGTFDSSGQALLYFLGRWAGGVDGLVHHIPFPGHMAIGVGS